MQNRLLLVLLPLLAASALPTRAQSVGIGTTTPDASAALEVQSTTQGLLLPRLSLAQRQALGTGSIAPPVAGLVIYQTDNTPGLYAYDGTAWVRLGGADNLGNHTATQPLNLQGNALVGTGSDIGTTVGLGVRADGGLNLGENSPGNLLAIGYQAGQASTVPHNQFVGYQSGQANTTGGENQFSGYQSGYFNTTGGQNQFDGFQAGYSTSSGGGNQFVGYNSGYSNKTGTFNLFSGYASGYLSQSGNYNVFDGPYSGYNNSTGSQNTFSGLGSGSDNTTGSDNVFNGYQSGIHNVTGSNNTALGYESGPAAGSGDLTNATALGANVTLTTSNTVVLGNNAYVGIGTSAPFSQLANTDTNIIGSDGQGGNPGSLAWSASQAGYVGLFYNADAGGGARNGLAVKVAGTDPGVSVLDVSAGAAQGTSGTPVLSARANGRVGVGTNSPGHPLTVQADASANSQLLGFNTNAGSDKYNFSLAGGGLNLSESNVAGGRIFVQDGGNVGIGTTSPAARLDVNGSLRASSAYVASALTGNGAELPAGTVAVGVRADGGLNLGQYTAGNNLYLGYEAGSANSTGQQNQFIGYQSGLSNTTGQNNTFSGYLSGNANVGGNRNTFTGRLSGYKSTADDNTFFGFQSGTDTDTGKNNTYVGSFCGSQASSANNNTAIGGASGANLSTGNFNAYIGAYSGYYNETGMGNTALGYASGPTTNALDNTIAIGFGAKVSTSNTIQLGTATITSLRCQVGLTVTSDARFKYDVQANVPGLAFISQLRPVTYRLDAARLAAFDQNGTLPARSAPDPAAAVHTGFLAQDVERVAQSLGYAFDGLHAPTSARDHYGLGYAQFVVPLVQAVQELNAKVEALTAENAALKATAAQAAADHASLLTLQAQVARLLGEGAQAQR